MAPLLRLLGFATAYLACAGTLSVSEAVAAAGAGLAALAAHEALARTGRRFAVPRLREAARLPGIAARIAADTAYLTAAYLRPLATGRAPRGDFVASPCDLGARTPESRTRRAVALIAASAAPASYVVAQSYETRQVLRHCLPAPTENPS